MTLGQWWGGCLSQAIDQLPSEEKEIVLPGLLKDLESSDTFIPFSFRSINYRDIFEVEGLGYEYWLATARLRCVGKGSRLFFDGGTGEFTYDPDPALDEAIGRFDKRLGATKFLTTQIGVTLAVTGEDEALKTMTILQYNVASRDVSPILKALAFDVMAATGSVGNFVPLFLSLENLLKSHEYLNPVFEEGVLNSSSLYGFSGHYLILP